MPYSDEVWGNVNLGLLAQTPSGRKASMQVRIDTKLLEQALRRCAAAVWPAEFARALTPAVRATMHEAAIAPFELLQIGRAIAHAVGVTEVPSITDDCDPEFPEERYIVLCVSVPGDARRIARARTQAAKAMVQSVPADKRSRLRIVMDARDH